MAALIRCVRARFFRQPAECARMGSRKREGGVAGGW